MRIRWTSEGVFKVRGNLVGTVYDARGGTHTLVGQQVLQLSEEE